MARNQPKKEPKGKQPKFVKQPGKVKPSPAAALPHEPGTLPASVDVVGVLPEDVHAEPEITEGHPGYEEAGASEIRPFKPSNSNKPK
ncbi:MAG TPA: hypothetical protein VHE81_09525 [Lacipirellulaceae bacterium]|nr:hypothetical protein [Lacipirellulaceae bacterium]